MDDWGAKGYVGPPFKLLGGGPFLPTPMILHLANLLRIIRYEQVCGPPKTLHDCVGQNRLDWSKHVIEVLIEYLRVLRLSSSALPRSEEVQ